VRGNWLGLLRVSLVAYVLVAVAVVGSARATPAFGDPFRGVVNLAGTWAITTGDLTPGEATAADLSRWGSVAVPGKWTGTPAGASYAAAPAAWIGIDVHAPNGTAIDRTAVALPPFLYAYEAFAGGERLGGSGVLAPSLDWGPFRHTVFAVPRGAWGADGVLRLRVHVQSWRGAFGNGTHSAADARAIAIGPEEDVARLVELSHARLQSERPLGGGTHYLMFGIALVFLALFALTPALRENAYFSAYLVLSSMAAMRAEAASLGNADHPLAPILESVVLACLSGIAALLMLDHLFVLRSRFYRTAIGLQLVFLAIIGFVWLEPGSLQDGNWYNVYLPLHTVVTLACTLGALARCARQNVPDARLMITGFGVALVIVLLNNAYGLVFPGAARSMTAVPTGWLGFFAALVWSMTMAFVLGRRYRRSIDDLNHAFAASTRFVPSAFLRLLGRENVVLVQRGDRTHRDMTVLFCDIRRFTPLAERLGPEETIAFLNRYLLAIEPAIVDRGGFINQYYGDGIMALFERADDAVAASTAMMQAVDAFNVDEHRVSGERVRIGVGLNAGPLAMGIIGGRVRLDSGVVGDVVNTAARVEGMTKLYGARVLLTDAVRERLTKPVHADLREIDRVIAVGKRVALTLFELVVADPAELLVGKRATRADFDRGLERVRAGDLEGAVTSFTVCTERVTEDGSASVWAARCDAWRREGMPADWDGVTVLGSK